MECDVALIGNGCATLLAANLLRKAGRNVAILNPDPDFFLEDSELPLDPLIPLPEENFNFDRISLSLSDTAFDILRPEYPGSIEHVVVGESSRRTAGNETPYVRSRSRLWVRSVQDLSEGEPKRRWETIENLFVHASDQGLSPQEIPGHAVYSRFPGHSKIGASPDANRGILIARIADIDVNRYRSGLLAFCRERIGPQAIWCGISHLDFTKGAIEFFSRDKMEKLKVKESVFFFWTPKCGGSIREWLIARLKSSAEKKMLQNYLPKSISWIEEWKLLSRDPIDPGMIASYEDNVVWASFEGHPSEAHEMNLLTVMRPTQALETAAVPRDESFRSLSRLCTDFLKWEKFSVREMKMRKIFNWAGAEPLETHLDGFPFTLIPSCDGYLTKIVHSVRSALGRVD